MNRDRCHAHLTEAFLAAGGEYRPAGSPDDLLHGALSSLCGAVRTNNADGFRRASDRLRQLADAIRPTCDYCGATENPRVLHDDPALGVPRVLTCEGCYSPPEPELCGGAQVAPGFDDLEPVEPEVDEICCPVGDPDCMGGDGDCHDACERADLPAAETAGA